MLPSRRFFLPCSALAVLVGCGARSQLGVSDLEGSAGSGASNGAGGGVISTDACPAAVEGPKAMAGNCSTRDGRSRVSAPSSPHVTWSAKLPTDSTGMVGPSAIASDASGHAYVALTAETSAPVSAFVRVEADTGTIDWTVPIEPDEATTGSTPILLAHGGVELSAYAPPQTESVFTFDPASGASTSTTFGFSLYDGDGNFAVGADGSLVVTHADGVGTIKQTTYVSRVSPAGKVLWTSPDLATLAPPANTGDGEVFPSVVALGQGDLVVLVTGVLAAPGEISQVIALDPATGIPRWTTQLVGQLVGGPAIRPDGAIVVLTDGNDGTSSLVVVDSQTGTPTAVPLASGAFGMSAVTTSGVVIASSDAGNGVSGLVALGPDGASLWTNPATGKASVASDGTVLVFGKDVVAVDGATGQTKWQLAPPSASPCIIDGALTSDGKLVVLACDGTLFGASD